MMFFFHVLVYGFFLKYLIKRKTKNKVKEHVRVTNASVLPSVGIGGTPLFV